MTLWHYTCDHGRALIGDEGTLRCVLDLAANVNRADFPVWQQTLLDLIWLTDLDRPWRDALGLTMRSIDCDRTAHRYRVVNYSAMHYPSIRRDLPKRLRDEIESAPGALPQHWWVAYTPVPVIYDPITTIGREAS